MRKFRPAYDPDHRNEGIDGAVERGAIEYFEAAESLNRDRGFRLFLIDGVIYTCQIEYQSPERYLNQIGCYIAEGNLRDRR